MWRLSAVWLVVALFHRSIAGAMEVKAQKSKCHKHQPVSQSGSWVSTLLPPSTNHRPPFLPPITANFFSFYLFLPSFLHSYLPAFLPSFLPTYLPFFLPSFLPSFLPFFLPSYLPSFHSSFLPTILSLIQRIARGWQGTSVELFDDTHMWLRVPQQRRPSPNAAPWCRKSCTAGLSQTDRLRV